VIGFRMFLGNGRGHYTLTGCLRHGKDGKGGRRGSVGGRSSRIVKVGGDDFVML
jgi:hypothetical protein